jgi:hypothetical protein
LDREGLVDLFKNNYRDEVTKAITSCQRNSLGREDAGVVTQEQKRSDQQKIDQLVNKCSILPRQDLVFLVDYLLTLCKNMQFDYKHSVILACYLLKTAMTRKENFEKLKKVIEEASS